MTVARTFIGTPYHHAAAAKGIGCDCLGLVRGVWRDIHGAEPERVPAYGPVWLSGETIERLAEGARRHFHEIAPRDAGPGDVLLFRWRQGQPARHVAILSFAGRMIHAQEGVAVSEVVLGSWWRRRLAFSFRFPGVQD